LLNETGGSKPHVVFHGSDNIMSKHQTGIAFTPKDAACGLHVSNVCFAIQKKSQIIPIPGLFYFYMYMIKNNKFLIRMH